MFNGMDGHIVNALIEVRRFKSVPPTAPLGFASASEGKRFGTGSGFGGEGKTFGCADG